MSDGRSIDTHISFRSTCCSEIVYRSACINTALKASFLALLLSLSLFLLFILSLSSPLPSTLLVLSSLFPSKTPRAQPAVTPCIIYPCLLPPCSFVVYRVVLRTFEKTSLRFFILNRTVIRRCDRSCLFLVDNTLYVCYYGNYKVKFVIKNAGLFTFSVYII